MRGKVLGPRVVLSPSAQEERGLVGECAIGKTCFDVIKAIKDNKLMFEQEKASEARATPLAKITAAKSGFGGFGW